MSAEMICPYPPGIPITASGDRLTTTVVDSLQQLAGTGTMEERRRGALEHVRVIAA